MSQSNGKHISFEDECSDGSVDEDCSPVEVVFDRTTNPYRRKSSMVASEMKAPHIKRPTKRNECLVHQFLDSQRRARDAASSASDPDSEYSLSQNTYLNTLANHDGGMDLLREQDMETLAEPKDEKNEKNDKNEKNEKNCRAVVDHVSFEGNGTGQADQQAWTQQMTTSMSELDLTSNYEDVHSRLLTKKQLSEMAWGVRELSRRLSSMRIRFRVKTIFLLTKIYDQDLIPKTRAITKWLLHHDRDVKYTVFVQDKLKNNKKFDANGLVDELSEDLATAGKGDKEAGRESIEKRLHYWSKDMCRTRPHTFDFVITLGGDGTVLYASWLFQRIVPPVLSFALGSLGFLTKFDFEGYEKTLVSAFTKGVTVSLRLRFEGTVMRSQKRKRLEVEQGSEEDEDELHRQRDLVEELVGEEREDERTHRPDGTFEILNEIVVDRGPNPTMSTTEVFGDDEHFTSVLADGICVSTPTGSTAYNLAAGGSLCHPENPVMLVTSICAHTLSFRPIILPDTIVLRVGVPYDARNSSWASFDGRERVELKPGDYVTISASRFPFASVQAEGRRSEDWVNSISGKLGWNTRQKQKGYKEWDK